MLAVLKPLFILVGASKEAAQQRRIRKMTRSITLNQHVIRGILTRSENHPGCLILNTYPTPYRDKVIGEICFRERLFEVYETSHPKKIAKIIKGAQVPQRPAFPFPIFEAVISFSSTGLCIGMDEYQREIIEFPKNERVKWLSINPGCLEYFRGYHEPMEKLTSERAREIHENKLAKQQAKTTSQSSA